MKDLIKKLLGESKTDAEIIVAVLEMEEAKALDHKAISDMISSAKKAEDVIADLKAKADAQKKIDDVKKEGDAVEKRIDDAFEKKMKSINVDPFGNFKEQKELKSFDPATGKIIAIKTDVSTAYAAMNAMLYAGLIGDKATAHAISREIDQDNADYYKAENTKMAAILEKHGVKAANDPTVSDVAARGGFSIPIEVDMVINQLIYAQSVMLTNMNTDNIVFQSKIYPLMYGMTVSDIADQDTAVTESQTVFDNPTVNMKRAGTYTNISNTIMRQKGADIVRAVSSGIAGAFAEFFDLRLAVGNVATQGDLTNGIVFDANTKLPTPITLASLSLDDIDSLQTTTISEKASNLVYIANRKVVSKIGLLENSAGNREFPQYINGGSVSPFGIPLVKNAQIPSTLNIGGDARLGGTDDVLMLLDAKQVVAGISGPTRIASSEHWRFTNDETTIRGIKEYGSKVLSSETTGGVVAAALELTAA